MAGTSRLANPRVTISFLPVLIGMIVLCASNSSSAEVLTVGSGARFETIRAAIEGARPGDTIEVLAGTYPGDLILDKSLELVGTGNPLIRGSGRGSTIVIQAANCTIRGFTIEHSGGDLQQEDSGILLKSNGNRLENNDLRDVLYGIYLYRARANIIRYNTIRGRRELEIGERGAGLHLWDSPGNTIENNTISETRDGLYIQSSPDNIIRHNRVSTLRYGVHYMFSEANFFEDNVFEDNVAGAAIMYSNHITFRRNAFVRNRGFSSFGILFQECNHCLAEDNFIIDNATGIFMEALRYSTFRGNVIAENDVALQMFSSADENLFCQNNFVENLSPLQLIGRRTTTRWEEGGQGNYWSDYDGYDLDGDGVGDVPHRIQNVFEYMEGNHPRLRLYLESPAAHALSLAEKAFPIIQITHEADRAPLMKARALHFPPPGPRSGPSDGSALMTLSSMMLAGALAIIVWGRRR